MRNLPNQLPPLRLYCVTDYWGFAAGNQPSVTDYILKLTFTTPPSSDDGWRMEETRQEENKRSDVRMKLLAADGVRVFLCWVRRVYICQTQYSSSIQLNYSEESFMQITAEIQSNRQYSSHGGGRSYQVIITRCNMFTSLPFWSMSNIISVNQFNHFRAAEHKLTLL